MLEKLFEMMAEFHDAKRTEEEIYPVPHVIPLIMQLLLKLQIKHNNEDNAGLARSTGGCEFERGHIFTHGLKITE